MVVHLLGLQYGLGHSTRLRFPCTCNIQFKHKGVAIGGLVLWTRFEFEVRRVSVQRNQTDAVSKDFVLDNRSIVPDVYMFDGNCRNLICDEEIKKITLREAEWTYRTSAISILRRAFAMEASTPTRSNWIDRCDSLLTLMCNIYMACEFVGKSQQ